MLNPEYLMQAADPVVEIYSQVEQDILEDIARRVVKTGYFTDTAQWQLKKAKEFGYLQGDVNDILVKATGLSQKEIKKLMTAAGTKSLAFDDVIYKAAGIWPRPSPIARRHTLPRTSPSCTRRSARSRRTSMRSRATPRWPHS